MSCELDGEIHLHSVAERVSERVGKRERKRGKQTDDKYINVCCKRRVYCLQGQQEERESENEDEKKGKKECMGRWGCGSREEGVKEEKRRTGRYNESGRSWRKR